MHNATHWESKATYGKRACSLLAQTGTQMDFFNLKKHHILISSSSLLNVQPDFGGIFPHGH